MNGEWSGRAFNQANARPQPAQSVISQLLEVAEGGAGRPPASTPEALTDAGGEPAALPKPGDPYQAYARPTRLMLPTLYLLLGDGTRRAFPYGSRVGGPDLVDSPGGPVIVLRFLDMMPMEVVLAGRHLDELYHAVGYHAVAWVRELPPGKLVSDHTLPVVTAIAVRRWLPPEG